MIKPRKCKNWIHSLIEYVEDTESPRDFWVWAGLFCLTSAMQRKCWLKFGMDNLYPNLYIMIIAPPGRCRKGSPVGFAKKILSDEGIQIPVFVDSPTKRALTKMLAELTATAGFRYTKPNGTVEYKPQAPLALVSKELSSFLAVNPNDMIDILTDLFDSHDVWEYKTSEKGTDKIYGVCLNCIFASTPTWIASNLPEEAVGGGFTSRFVVVPGFEKYKQVPIPSSGDNKLYAKLVADLARISRLIGEFIFSDDAKQTYTSWYMTIESKVKKTHDERMHAYLERMHIIALKVAMALSVAESDELILTAENMRMAINMVELVLREAPKAFGALGRSNLAIITDEVRNHIKVLGQVSFGELLKINYRNTNRMELKEVLRSLEDMGQIRTDSTFEHGRESMEIFWIKRKEQTYN